MVLHAVPMWTSVIHQATSRYVSLIKLGVSVVISALATPLTTVSQGISNWDLKLWFEIGLLINCSLHGI